MRVKHFLTGLLVIFLGFVLTGCAGLSTKPTADLTCTSKDIGALLKSGEYQKKVDNFLIILDASTSMSDKLGKDFTYEPSKLVLAKDLIQCLNNTLPADLDVNGGMRVFGPVYAEKGLVYGMTKYSKAGLQDAVLAVGGTGGVTPLANAIVHANKDLYDMPGDAAVIIFSDGINTEPDSPVAAAATMKDMYGDNVCIYTVLLGNDPKGKTTMEQIAKTGECGFATGANNLAYRTLSDGTSLGLTDGMADFVTYVFLEKVKAKMETVSPPMPPPMESKVSITLLIEFDFDKAVVKPQYHSELEKVAKFMKTYPKTTGQLEGHTDSIGTEEYNMNLSKRRAESVKNYLIDKFGIDPARLSTVAYGESKPIASNDTAAGRQKNRRVVANMVTITMK
jgi:OOP family OmpA-OmpF porin